MKIISDLDNTIIRMILMFFLTNFIFDNTILYQEEQGQL